MGNATKVVVGLAMLLFVATPVLAEQGQIQLNSALPVTVTGDRTTFADDGAFLLQGDSGQVSLRIEGAESSLSRIVHRAYAVVNHDDPEAGILWEQRVEQENIPLDHSIITLDERKPGFTLLAFDGPMAVHDGAASTPLHIGVLSSPKLVASEAAPPIQFILGESDSKPFTHLLPSGSFESRSLDGRVTSDGGLQLYLADAVLALYDENGHERILRAHFREEVRDGGIFDPVARQWTGPGEHTEFVHEYLVMDLSSADVQLQYRNIPATLFAAVPLIEATGTASFPAATGTVTMDDGTTHNVAQDDVELTGRFAFAMAGTTDGRTRAQVTGEGDLVEVTYQSTTHNYDWATVAAVTGIGAVLLAIGAWVTGAGKWLLGSMGGLVAGYARVHGDAVLQHDGRQQVYELVQSSPGMHFMDMCEQLPFGASTLNYHLRVLERNEFVTRVKDGRYVRFFDRRNGHFSGDRKTAMSALRNTTTAAIAQHIVSHPGIVQRDLASRFQIAPSTVSWHVERLQRNGLVEKQRDSHFTRYYMGQAWTSLPSDERIRFGVA